MASYLVVMDDSQEASVALRLVARRAARSGSQVEILSVIPRQDFVEWGGVQAAIEEEARLRAEAAVLQASGAIFEEAGIRPSILVREGDPVKVIGDLVRERDDIGVLVLGAAADGVPGPLVAHFASVAGTLPCPLMIVPGSLRDELLDSLG